MWNVQKPRVVTLCGSTRFKDIFVKTQLDETLTGNIVLTIGCAMHADPEIFAHLSDAQMERTKRQLDWLHMRKIDLSDEILVLNVGGYVGESTGREIAYAYAKNLPIRWLEPAVMSRANAAAYYERYKLDPMFLQLTALPREAP